MRLALDARTVFRPQRRGTGKNLLDLYRAVAELRPSWRVMALHREQVGPAALLPAPFAEPRALAMPGDRFDAWERLRLPLAAWRGGADLLHCPSNTCPAWMPVPTLVTIHDLIPLDLPDSRPPEQVRRFARSIRTACRAAAGIVCPSSYTRDRLVAEFHADAGRVTVNAWAADTAMRRVTADELAPVLRRYGVRPPVVLHFGGADPRKNTARVLDAWTRLRPALRREWQLLVVGLDPPALAQASASLARRGQADGVRLHGFADEGDLPALLSAADVLAFPSLSEGFGLPILDAWRTHTAVLTSNRTSLPEVAGDAALLVEPADADAIAAGLASLLEDARLRAELARRGEERLRGYTWRATAKRFIAAAEHAAGLSRARADAA